MGLQATYKTGLPPEAVQERALKSGSFKVVPRYDGVHVMLYPLHHQDCKVQALGAGVFNVWAPDLDQLHEIEDLLNEVFGDSLNPEPFEKPIKVQRQGSKPAYYETREEVIERLTLDPSAVSILNLDGELESYSPGSQEKIELLSAAAEAVGRLLGPFTIPVFERAVEAETDREAVRILVKGVPRVFDDFASYFLWLLREHRDVAQEALRWDALRLSRRRTS